MPVPLLTQADRTPRVTPAILNGCCSRVLHGSFRLCRHGCSRLVDRSAFLLTAAFESTEEIGNAQDVDVLERAEAQQILVTTDNHS